MPQTRSGAVDMMRAIFPAVGHVYLAAETASGEVTGASYDRLVNTEAHRSQDPTTGAVTITQAGEFANPTTEDWGEVIYLSVWTASSGGVRKWRARIVDVDGREVELNVATGDRLFFAANTLVFGAGNSVP